MKETWSLPMLFLARRSDPRVILGAKRKIPIFVFELRLLDFKSAKPTLGFPLPR